MNDLIYRAAALNAIKMAEFGKEYEAVECLPSADANENKHGRWAIAEDDDGLYGICSECNTDADFNHYGKSFMYCPNCGAKMDGGGC